MGTSDYAYIGGIGGPPFVVFFPPPPPTLESYLRRELDFLSQGERTTLIGALKNASVQTNEQRIEAALQNINQPLKNQVIKEELAVRRLTYSLMIGALGLIAGAVAGLALMPLGFPASVVLLTAAAGLVLFGVATWLITHFTCKPKQETEIEQQKFESKKVEVTSILNKAFDLFPTSLTIKDGDVDNEEGHSPPSPPTS